MQNHIWCLLNDNTYIYSRETLNEYLESLGFDINDLVIWLSWNDNLYCEEEVNDIVAEYQEEIDVRQSKIEYAQFKIGQIARDIHRLYGNIEPVESLMRVINDLGY